MTPSTYSRFITLGFGVGLYKCPPLLTIRLAHHSSELAALIVVMATAVILIAVIAVVLIVTTLELAPYGTLGRLLVGDANVEPTRVFKELQA